MVVFSRQTRMGKNLITSGRPLARHKKISVQYVPCQVSCVLRAISHAELAPECATAYHHYGTAIFYKAQEEQDVFGAPLQQAAEEQEEGEEQPREKTSQRGRSSCPAKMSLIVQVIAWQP